MLELDFKPTTSRRSDRFILAVSSPLLSPVFRVWKNKYVQSLTKAWGHVPFSISTVLTITILHAVRDIASRWSRRLTAAHIRPLREEVRRSAHTSLAISRCFSAKYMAC